MFPFGLKAAEFNVMESGSFDDIPACAPARTNKHQETTLPKSKNYQNVKVEPLDEDLQTPNKDVPVSPCLGTQVSVKSEPANNAEVLEDIIDHMLLGDRMRLLASRKFPKTSFFENFDSRTFMSFDNGDKPTVSESSKPLLMKRPRKKRKTAMYVHSYNTKSMKQQANGNNQSHMPSSAVNTQTYQTAPPANQPFWRT